MIAQLVLAALLPSSAIEAPAPQEAKWDFPKQYAEARKRLWEIGVEVGGIYSRECSRPGEFGKYLETGLSISSVRKGSAAEKAGLQNGDIVTTSDGKTVGLIAFCQYKGFQFVLQIAISNKEPNQADLEFASLLRKKGRSTWEIYRFTFNPAFDGWNNRYLFEALTLKVDLP